VRNLVPHALVVVAAVGAAVWSADIAVERSSTDTRAEVRRLAVTIAQHSRDASIAGCNRSKEDRMDAIRGWRTALNARRETAHNPHVGTRERLAAAAAAAVYREVIRSYAGRLVDCSQAFPPPTDR
jgi:hypothetical protein